MNFDYIKSYYKVPAEYGREIMFEGKRKGVIVEDMGNYIGVNFDDTKPSVILPLHPKDSVEYLGIVKPRKISRGAQRYREFIQADTCMTFAEWLGIRKNNNHESRIER